MQVRKNFSNCCVYGGAMHVALMATATLLPNLPALEDAPRKFGACPRNEMVVLPLPSWAAAAAAAATLTLKLAHTCLSEVYATVVSTTVLAPHAAFVTA